MPLTWKDRIKVSIASGGTGTLTLGSAASGYQTFAAGDDGKLFPYVIENGTAWETGYGTYTHAGTTFARTSRTASSSGSAIDAGTGNLYVDLVSNNADNMNLAAQAITPGGRLTLTTGVPVTTSDVTGATNVYYTPYLHNIINLWDGNIWKTVVFAETTEALGTLTSDLPYDVFGFLSSGALDLEKLAWTNATTRATAITLQDGRYCKSGDKARLYLGTFCTTSTTTTEDSAARRLLWNMYNRSVRNLLMLDSTASWTYSTSDYRVARGQTPPTNCVQILAGLAEDVADINAQSTATTNNATPTSHTTAIGEDSTTTPHASCLIFHNDQVTNIAAGTTFSRLSVVVPLGLHYYSWLEWATGTYTTTWYGTATSAGDVYAREGINGRWMS